MNWSGVTALFGGTFDPPHLGHRRAAEGLLQDLGLKSVQILPTPTPPHKPALVSLEHRLAMVELNFEGMAAEITVDRRELKRSGPSYTFDTLQEVRWQIPSIAFVIGTDQLTRLNTWYRFPEVLGLCHWIVLERKPTGHTLALRALKDWQGSGLARAERDPCTFRLPNAMVLKVIPTDAPAVSSTDIREEIARNGKPPEGMLHPEVEAYLKRHRLYGMAG
jgi:nicotinate-nucleotide adenylyltransferase